jgi:hypothetical protein
MRFPLANVRGLNSSRAIHDPLTGSDSDLPTDAGELNLSAQQRQAILDYQLTLPGAEHLIMAMEAMTKYPTTASASPPNRGPRKNCLPQSALDSGGSTDRMKMGTGFAFRGGLKSARPVLSRVER